MAKLTDDQIREAAYHMWKEDGEPQGMDLEYWFRAEQRLAPKKAPAKKPASKKPAAKATAAKKPAAKKPAAKKPATRAKTAK